MDITPRKVQACFLGKITCKNSVASSEKSRFSFEIPDNDNQHDIHRGSLAQTLDLIRRAGPTGKEVKWSGTRNCAIAILLFATRLRFSNGSPGLLVNPMGASGHQQRLTALRVALYRLQKVRNGFIHRDVAKWSDVRKALSQFKKCVRGMANAFYLD
jgi:hypothetical protein